MKQITITVPDNCELKQDGNTYTIVEKEKLTYEDIAKELFYEKSGYYIDYSGHIYGCSSFSSVSFKDPINCISEKQAKKLLAINKLINVAKYLNGDWQPDWNNKREYKYFIVLTDEKFRIYDHQILQGCDIDFKSEELAEKAIEILGEEVIRLALCTDY